MAKDGKGGKRAKSGPTGGGGQLLLPPPSSESEKSKKYTIATRDGDIELSEDIAHLYSYLPTAMSSTIRDKVISWEKKRAKQKVEYGYAVLEDGTVIPEVRGKKGEVKAPMSMKQAGATFTHIHPRTGDQAGLLGGTFSCGRKYGIITGDIGVFCHYPQKAMRAVCKEGTYYMEKLDNFRASDFATACADFEEKNRAEYSKRSKSVTNEYYKGNITYDECKHRLRNEFNTYVTKSHHWFETHAVEYGYEYRIEKWR